MISHLNAITVVLDIGSNDISNKNNSPYQIANYLVELAENVTEKYNVTVVIMPQFKRTKGTGDCNASSFNARLECF